MHEASDKGIDFKTFNQEAEIEKFKDIEVLGYNIMIRLYTTPDKIGNIILTEQARDKDKYTNFVGLVVGMGKGAYSNKERFKETGAWCKVGDWVSFPRHAGHRTSFKGIPIFILDEDVLSTKILNPAQNVPQYSK